MSEWDQSAWTKDDLVGGHPVLDFVNTVAGRSKERSVERLTDYGAFLNWAVVAEVLFPGEAARLRNLGLNDPAGAGAALAAVVAFREALHACLMAEQAGEVWPEPQRRQVMQVIRDALLDARFEKGTRSYAWSAPLSEPDMALPLKRIALAAEDLLRSDDLPRMRNCDRCSWLFIDRGRGRARRWCSMAACGSRAKSARYYKRQKASHA